MSAVGDELNKFLQTTKFIGVPPEVIAEISFKSAWARCTEINDANKLFSQRELPKILKACEAERDEYKLKSQMTNTSWPYEKKLNAEIGEWKQRAEVAIDWKNRLEAQLTTERDVVMVFREAITTECYCHELHPDTGGKCHFCHALAKENQLRGGG